MLENLTHAPFIIASYMIAFITLGSVGLLSWRRTKKLEAEAEALKEKAPARQRRRAK